MAKSTMTEGRAAGNVKRDLFLRNPSDCEQTRQQLELHPQVGAGLRVRGGVGARGSSTPKSSVKSAASDIVIPKNPPLQASPTTPDPEFCGCPGPWTDTNQARPVDAASTQSQTVGLKHQPARTCWQPFTEVSAVLL